MLVEQGTAAAEAASKVISEVANNPGVIAVLTEAAKQSPIVALLIGAIFVLGCLWIICHALVAWQRNLLMKDPAVAEVFRGMKLDEHFMKLAVQDSKERSKLLAQKAKERREAKGKHA